MGFGLTGKFYANLSPVQIIISVLPRLLCLSEAINKFTAFERTFGKLLIKHP